MARGGVAAAAHGGKVFGPGRTSISSFVRVETHASFPSNGETNVGSTDLDEIMASTLGDLIRETRLSKDIGIQELARRLDHYGSAISRLKRTDPPPPLAEETLASIAEELDLNPDRVITLAGKVPYDVNTRR